LGEGCGTLKKQNFSFLLLLLIDEDAKHIITHHLNINIAEEDCLPSLHTIEARVVPHLTYKPTISKRITDFVKTKDMEIKKTLKQHKIVDLLDVKSCFSPLLLGKKDAD